MNKLSKNSIKGFTLMELMIVIVVVAILLSLAYPSYVGYTRKAKRGEAQQILMNWAVNQEIWRSNNASYSSDDGMKPADTTYYSFVATVANATAYTLTATASGDQANDKARGGWTCTPMALTSTGIKYSGGDTAKSECWQ